uniref:Uncharacterized protein n=1 Tax=Glossina austeni TaxID=7395 RepID=A0A1A9VF59_GLOAU
MQSYLLIKLATSFTQMPHNGQMMIPIHNLTRRSGLATYHNTISVCDCSNQIWALHIIFLFLFLFLFPICNYWKIVRISLCDMDVTVWEVSVDCLALRQSVDTKAEMVQKVEGRICTPFLDGSKSSLKASG